MLPPKEVLGLEGVKSAHMGEINVKINRHTELSERHGGVRSMCEKHVSQRYQWDR